ncbi:MAG: aminopeptidase N [Nocardioides sp.]
MSKSHLSAPSLRQTEAESRHDLLDVTSYDVRLNLASDPETFGSVTTIHFESRGGPTFVDLKPVRVNDLRFNDAPLDPTLLNEGRLPLDTVAGSNVLRVDALMGFRNDGEGLHRSVDPADGRHYVYGMSFMDAAPSVFACFDQPDLKAPYTFHVTAPRDWTVVGNAPGEQVEPGTWELATTKPLSTYFVTIVAGPYHVLRAEHDGIPLGLSARASLARELERDAEELFTMTGQCFDEYHRHFGIRYPFGGYHQAFVPEFNAGAMENPGCVTYRDPYLFPSRVTRGSRVLRATTLAHEMAHQWFGNIVTPKWWDDLWLNESFAEYLGNRVTADVTEYDDAMVHLSYQRRQWGLNSDQLPSTHPVAGNGAADALSALQDFDGISYVKGASVLRQVNATIGDEVFFAGVVDHLTRHRFGNATMHDLFAGWEHAGAGDLSAFTGEWLRVAGADVIELDRAAGVLRRTPPPEHPADRPHRFTVAQADSGHWRRVEVALTGPETSYDAGSAPVVIDPEEESWGVYVPDRTTLAGLVDLLPEVKDEALRAGVWNNVRSGFHHGAVDPADVVDLLVASLPIEDSEDSARHLMPWVLGWVLPAAPPGSLERVNAAALAKVTECGVGSELQLSAFRAAVHTCDDVSMLRGWLERMPEGLELDVDLRWRLLVRLATLGATDRGELDAALADEPTGQSRVEHTRAVASLPTAEGKAFAWERFVGTVDVPNYELEAAGRGMWRGGHDAVTEEYVDRYFTDLPGTAEVRSGWMLGVATGAFFPATAERQEVLDRARAVIVQPDLDRTIHRQLVDSADDLRRKLAIRETFQVR